MSALIAGLLSAALVSQAVAQQPVRTDTLMLSLRAAVARAARQSEEVRLAHAQLDLAETQVTSARSLALPHISANLGYTRTFASQFASSSFSLPDSLKFEPDSLASILERIGYLEQHTPDAGLAALGTLFTNLPFGRQNAYAATLSLSQSVWSGGRVLPAIEAARNWRAAADLQVREQLADIELNVQTAYYHSLLALEVERISAAAIVQASRFLNEERLRERAGTSSELDVLRAEVTLANLRPQLVSARNAAELALLDLRRLINVPAAQPLFLSTPFTVPSDEDLCETAKLTDDWVASRAAIRSAEKQLRIRELAVRVARNAYLPSVSLRMNYGRLLYPSTAFGFQGEWRADWSATLSVDVPIFDGFRRESLIAEAQVQLTTARLQLAQLKEGVALQYEQARGERDRAAATITARQQTVKQAQRVHDLTVLRYDKGLATQLDVSDARLALLQARTNLAHGLMDFYVADATLTRVLGGVDAVAALRAR